MAELTAKQRDDLLSKAARALGKRWKWVTCPKYDHRVPGLHLRDGINDVSYYPGWNPLVDAADRHELLVSLKMTLAYEPSRGGWSVGAIKDGRFEWLAFDEEEALAVVTAAAQLGGLKVAGAAPVEKTAVSKTSEKAVPNEPGWVCEHPHYGKWFISRQAVLEDHKQDHRQAYPNEPMPADEHFDVDMWFGEQTSWVEIAAYGVQLAPPDLQAIAKEWLETMRRDTDWPETVTEVNAPNAPRRKRR